MTQARVYLRISDASEKDILENQRRAAIADANRTRRAPRPATPARTASNAGLTAETDLAARGETKIAPGSAVDDGKLVL